MTDKKDGNTTDLFHSALSGLSRSGVPLGQDDVHAETPGEPVCHVREALMDQILAKHPGLARTKLSKQMAEMVF